MRQIVLDTETTGIDPKQGHRIIEIGCVELVDRKLTHRHFHQYLQPEREIEQEAIDVHGITNEFLVDKPKFREVAAEFLEFVKGGQLVIHNAAFDIGFIDHEFRRLDPNFKSITEFCSVVDTLALAREKHPGQKNNLDALCKRYFVDNSARELHGALLDAEILADVYLNMTGGQTSLVLSAQEGEGGGNSGSAIRRLSVARQPLPVIMASEAELKEHEQTLDVIAKRSGDAVVWRQ
ncbi:DNA polymerase III subunit epsilon [Halioxenophilus sp. WMMB6]|uniref:DNA polymerase III subunit epsilon n=1 Tax=Halioxenophilus sp. WMMB6 TaxID=3073815 RepID=UPI00295EC50C|nr:DNA polymerase III subunit epsilon [Halioxenophilus sp. WMMB6]